ncbi:selenocysteine-specific translation elongation factor [Salipaludibacillus keqinensis]|uniref:Selenocysteine-specific elongation factor n=1 Tax=Salipaludibacillus keqinensis TaxID=2045207 RepID=A0A323TK50_9BACI|nr:selenocysteine-specific translation elongation factor [Salipaludibacillus keqinensis]PYZ95278.1 selenocysteine-specific translation elongation factor [Salipaludibacillus keqinensis]
MSKRFYTIGMAGHIDHGKTTLTKALTNIDTDRLKEEKERAISIELGYAPLTLDDESQVSVIDVPGHEKFIRQMIAGVAGIDLVLLVVAADEGVMPQTVEHLDILNLLGIHQGLIVVTKMDQVEEEMIELIEADISDQVEGTFFEGSELVFVDSLSQKGIPELREIIKQKLSTIPVRDAKGAFRLPIDQVFSVHGQGTVVRGTVYEGEVREGDTLEILPQQKKVRARQLQVHHEPQKSGRAGQRVAVNLGGISKHELNRGDVLVSTQHYSTTNTIDISLDTVDQLKYPVKQRGYIKLHIGTAEVYGKIVFFDRNELSEDKNVLCQLRLDDPVVTKRGDRFILRRPSPMETIGGGVVIDPQGEKYKFGEATIEKLQRKKEGSPEERLMDLLKLKKALSKKEVCAELSLSDDDFNEFVNPLLEEGTLLRFGNHYLLAKTYEEMLEIIEEELLTYHNEFPLRDGMELAQLKQDLNPYGKEIASSVIDQAITDGRMKKRGSAVASTTFEPGYPKQWEKRMKQVEETLMDQQLEVEPFSVILERAGLPDQWAQELKHFLVRQQWMKELDEKHLVSAKSFTKALSDLYDQTGERFTLQEAKQTLGLTRKYLVPLMELVDKSGYTKREDQERVWVKEPGK